MRKIKIRYIKQNNTYFLEKKYLFGWKRIGRYVDLYYGGIFWRPYSSENKKSLLNDVLKDYYKTDKTNIVIFEYPMIKTYSN